MPSHRADTPPLRRPRTGPGVSSTLTLDRPPVAVNLAPAAMPVADAPASSRRAAREARTLRDAQTALQTEAALTAQARRDEQSAMDARAYVERRAANAANAARDAELARAAESARDAAAAREAELARETELALIAEQDFQPEHVFDAGHPLPSSPPVSRGHEELDSRRTSLSRRASSTRRAPVKRSHTHLSASQVGIAGVLGIATIAAPISGVMASPAAKAQPNSIQASAAPSTTVSAQFPLLPGAGGTVVAFNAMPSTIAPAAETPSLIAAPRTMLVTRASRSGERSVLPGCDGVAKVTNAPNGQLPASSLCTLWDPKHSLRADAAVAIAKMNVAYKQHFGDNICLTDSYRTLSEQYRLRSLKPGLAAVPGTSEHGWGLAVDLCDGVQTGSGARFQWLRDNAPAYGWDNPDWARPGGSGPHEPWHWEYVAGETVSHPGQ